MIVFQTGFTITIDSSVKDKKKEERKRGKVRGEGEKWRFYISKRTQLRCLAGLAAPFLKFKSPLGFAPDRTKRLASSLGLIKILKSFFGIRDPPRAQQGAVRGGGVLVPKIFHWNPSIKETTKSSGIFHQHKGKTKTKTQIRL